MPANPASDKVLLTYPDPGYGRLCLFFSIVCLTYFCAGLIPENANTHLPALRQLISDHWWPFLVITTLLFSLSATVLEALFLYGQKFDPMTLEFDAENFYITVTGGERIVPLTDITAFRLIYGKRLVDNGHLPLYRYAICFGPPADPEEVQLTVFRRTGNIFSDFLTLVKEKNPAVEIKNSATSWD